MIGEKQMACNRKKKKSFIFVPNDDPTNIGILSLTTTAFTESLLDSWRKDKKTLPVVTREVRCLLELVDRKISDLRVDPNEQSLKAIMVINWASFSRFCMENIERIEGLSKNTFCTHTTHHFLLLANIFSFLIIRRQTLQINEK